SVIMPQYQRAPRAAKIDKLISIGIPYTSAVTFLDKKRCSINRFERPYRGVYPSGKKRFRLFIEFGRFYPADIRFSGGINRLFGIACKNLFYRIQHSF